MRLREIFFMIRTKGAHTIVSIQNVYSRACMPPVSQHVISVARLQTSSFQNSRSNKGICSQIRLRELYFSIYDFLYEYFRVIIHDDYMPLY